MSAPLVVVWLGTVGGPGPHEADLDAWAAARFVVVAAPDPAPTLPHSGHDDRLAERIEAELAALRAATLGQDPGQALVAARSLEALLLAHPELPEGAALLSEAWRAEAALHEGTAPEVARALLADAESLDGPRAAAFTTAQVAPRSPRAAASPPPTTPPSPLPAARAPAPLRGALVTDTVEIDGTPATPPFAVPGGVHQVRVLRGGRLAWASWVTADGTAVDAALPSSRPCDELDLAAVRDGGDHVETADSVRCPRYAVVRPAPGGRGIEVATCEGRRCGSWLPWQQGWGESFEDPVQPPRAPRSRAAWWPWAAGGVAGLAAGAVLLWRTGAFEREGPGRDSFTFVPPPSP